jgi:Outer membrane protein beta-barrel domain
MYNSEFEKQVQQKMEGLKMPPSDKLWGRIENELPKKSRRKKIVLLLLLLLGGCGLVWMLSQVYNRQPDSLSKSEKIQRADNADRSKDIAAVQHQADEKDSAGQISNAQKYETAQVLSGNEKKPALTATGTDKPVDVSVTKAGENAMKQINVKATPGLRRVTDPSSADSNNTKDDMVISKPLQKLAVVTKSRTRITATQQLPINDDLTLPNAAGTLTAAEPFMAHTLQHQAAAMNKNLLPRKKTAETDAGVPVVAKSDNKTGKKKWEYGITLAGGLSRQTSNPFTANNISPSAFGVTGMTADSFTRRKALIATKPAAAFEAGFYLLNLGAKKWSIQTGLHYSYMSYKRAVGKRVDSVRQYYFLNNPVTLNNFYQTGSERNYINKVHLLQLPLELQYSPGRKNNWRIFGGVTAGFLLQSNALVFVNSPEGYVPGNQVIKVTGKGAFNKFTVSLHTGIGFYHHTGLPFSAGLRLSYGAIPFTKKYIGNQHLLSSVLFVNIPLKK